MINHKSVFDLSGYNNIELLLRNHPIEIKISPINQLLKLSLTDILPELKRYLSQILHWNETSFFMIKNSEYFSDISAWILIRYSFGEKCYPLFEVNCSIPITIQISNHLENSIALTLETQWGHCCF